MGPEAAALLGGLAGLLLAAELAFFALYWCPRRAAWNAQPCSPHAPARLDAHDLFRRFVAAGDAIPELTNLSAYISLWFQGTPLSEVRRGNMEELMAYGFWYRTPQQMEAAGLGHVPVQMVDELERAWRHTFPPGYTKNAAVMSHMWDDLKVQYRPLAFYVAVELAALLTWGAMLAMGFRRRRLGGIIYYTRGFDRRAAAAGPAAAGPAPVLFLHGVGGLLIYLDLIWRIAALDGPVLAVDVRHVGMRLSPRIPCVDEMTSEIRAILDAERVDKACVVGHSYGTLVASRLVKRFPSRLHSLVLVDPVCFGMYMPHLLHNFFYRRLAIDFKRPKQLLLDLLVHFASRDLHLAAAFSRRFYWSDVIMWPEELPPGSTVVLGADDDLVHADEVNDMLRHVCGNTVNVHYAPGMFHGAFLVFPGVRQLVVRAIAAAARSAACDSGALTASAQERAAPPTRVTGVAAEAEAAAVVLALGLEELGGGAAAVDEAPDAAAKGASAAADAGAAKRAADAAAGAAKRAAAPRAARSLGARLLSIGAKRRVGAAAVVPAAAPEDLRAAHSEGSSSATSSDTEPGADAAAAAGEAVLPRRCAAAVRRAATAGCAAAGGGKALGEADADGALGGGAAGQALAGELRQLLLRSGTAPPQQQQQRDQQQPESAAPRPARRSMSVTMLALST